MDRTNEKITVIDLGTNTAHILIAQKKRDNFQILFKERHYTFLAENGIEFISEESQKRLFAALTTFRNQMKQYGCRNVLIVGTEALRVASNGANIIEKIRNNYGWNVEMLSGDQEAEFIFKGVSAAINLNVGNYLVMDIGGGSVEFIIGINGKLAWKRSFPIGIAKLHNLEFISDPLSPIQQDLLNNHIYTQLKSLINELKQHKNIKLIGAAGSFEILGNNFTKSEKELYTSVSKNHFLNYLEEVINLSEEERAKITWIPRERVKYVTMAIVLIRIAIDITNSEDILISPYALKEGIICDYFVF